MYGAFYILTFTFYILTLFLLLKIPVLPGLKELRPGQRTENIHGWCLTDIDVFFGLLAQVEIGAFAAAIGHDIGVFAGFGQVFVGHVFGGDALEFGRDVHFQELDFKMLPGGPGENHDFGQENSVLRNNLHNGVPVLRQRIGHCFGHRVKTETIKPDHIAFFRHDGEKAAVIGVGTASFFGDENTGVGYRYHVAVQIGDDEAGKLNQFIRLLLVVVLRLLRKGGSGEQQADGEQKKGTYHQWLYLS